MNLRYEMIMRYLSKETIRPRHTDTIDFCRSCNLVGSLVDFASSRLGVNFIPCLNKSLAN